MGILLLFRCDGHRVLPDFDVAIFQLSPQPACHLTQFLNLHEIPACQGSPIRVSGQARIMTQRKWIERLQQATLGDYLRGRAARRLGGTPLRPLDTGFVVFAAPNKCQMPCSNSSTALSKAPSCPT